MTMTTEQDDPLDVTYLLASADDISSKKSEQKQGRDGYQLIDARQRLLAIVRERVAADDADRLTGLCTGSFVGHKLLYSIASPAKVRELTGEPFNRGEVALVCAARALAALGLTLVSGPEQAGAHLEVFRRWIACSGLEVPSKPVHKVPAAIDTRHAPVMRHLARAGDLDLLSLIWMAELDGWLHRAHSSPVRPGPNTPVPLDLGRQGQLAVLSYSWVPGLPEGLIPDPATMTLSSADAKFRASLATAWKVAGGSSRGAVLWSLGDRTGPVTRVTGESSSLGFTVLLNEQHRLSRPLRGPLTVRRLRPRTAMVGRIDPAAPAVVSSVAGYDAKLSVVDENTRVILPRADYRTAVEANRKYGDNAQLVPVETWRQAAAAGRAIDRRRLLAIAVVSLLILISLLGGRYRISESQRAADSRASAADAAARDLLERSTDNLWERLQLDVRAYRTRDGLDTRERLRAWARQLRFAQVVVPMNRGDADAVVNADGSGAVTPDPTVSGRMLVWDFTASPPARFPADTDGVGPAVAAWLGRDVVAMSRSQGKTTLWNAHTGQRLREIDAGGDVLVADPRGRWLGYGSEGAEEFHVVDLQRGTVEAETVPLPGQLQRWGPRQAMLTPLVVVEGILTSGELVVAQGREVVALSRGGSHPLDRRAYLAQVVDLGQGQAVVAGCANGAYELFGLETSTVLASQALPDGSCEQPDQTTRAFTADLKQVITVEQAPSPRGRPEPESYVVLGSDTESLQTRRVEIPVGYDLVRAAVEASGAYRLVLNSADALLVLRIPSPDAMEDALIHAQDAVVTSDGRFLVLRFEDNRVETWDIAARRLVGTAPPGSAEFSQAGSSASLVTSPDSGMLVTVHHNRPAKLWQLPGLQPLGEIPLPAASEAFLDSVNVEEFSAEVSFVTNRLLRVSYGDATSTWSVAPLAKQTEAQLSLPDIAAPKDWQVVLPDLGQLLFVRGNHVQRNRLSDGALVPGSAFTLGNVPSEDFSSYDSTGFQPAIDPSGSLMAVFNVDAIEIWDLFEHQRVDRLPIAHRTAATDIQFGENANEVEFVLMDFYAKNAAGIFPQRWHRSATFDVLGWLRLGDAGVEQAAGIAPRTFAWPGADGALEPATPQSWLDRICRALPDLGHEDPPGLPDASWRRPVCADR